VYIVSAVLMSCSISLYNRQAASKSLDMQSWRTHLCRVMSGTTPRRLRQKVARSRLTYSGLELFNSKSSIALLQLLESLTICLSSSFSSFSPRSLTRYLQVIKCKVTFSHRPTRYRALGQELIPVYRQSARR